MADSYSLLLDQLNNESADTLDLLNAAHWTIENIEKINQIETTPNAIQNIIQDEVENIIHKNMRDDFIKPLFAIVPDEILSPPLLSTITMSGDLENVNIDDHNVALFEATKDVLAIFSNYGENYYMGYVPKKKLNSHVVRKKKSQPVKRERKKQGSGLCFSSQITFITIDKISGKELKFKIFKNNKLQLPGVQQNNISEVFRGIDCVLAVINKGLCSDPPGKIISLSPSMKNYKFYLKLPVCQFLDLTILNKILLVEKIKQKNPEMTQKTLIKSLKAQCNCSESDCPTCLKRQIISDNSVISCSEILLNITPEHPPIFDVEWSEEDTKLSIRFDTPLTHNPNKRVRVKIFRGKEIPLNYAQGIQPDTWGAKINIQGSLHDESTRKIYMYLLHIFQKWYNILVVTPGHDSDETYEYVVEDYCDIKNIKSMGDVDSLWDQKLAEIRPRPIKLSLSAESLAAIDQYLLEISNGQ